MEVNGKIITKYFDDGMVINYTFQEYSWGINVVLEKIYPHGPNNEYASRRFKFTERFDTIEKLHDRIISYYKLNDGDVSIDKESNFVDGDKVEVLLPEFQVFGKEWVVDHIKARGVNDGRPLIICCPIKPDGSKGMMFQFFKNQLRHSL